MNTYTLNLKPLTDKITVEHFERLCQLNPELKFETNSRGDLIVMSPTGYETGKVNADLITQFGMWNRQYKLGVVCDSSTGFILPNGAIRSPDVSWIASQRVANLTPEEREKFLPLAPDFVLELMSPSDRLNIVQDKLQEYIDNGVRSGWLINPKQQQVEVYCRGKSKKVLDKPSGLSGEDILPELVIDLDFIWK